MKIDNAEMILSIPTGCWAALEDHLRELRELTALMLEQAANPHELDMYHKGGLNMIDQIANVRNEAAEAIANAKNPGPEDGLPENE